MVQFERDDTEPFGEPRLGTDDPCQCCLGFVPRSEYIDSDPGAGDEDVERHLASEAARSSSVEMATRAGPVSRAARSFGVVAVTSGPNGQNGACASTIVAQRRKLALRVKAGQSL